MRFGMALFLNLEELCSQNKEQQAVCVCVGGVGWGAFYNWSVDVN